ncbi:MAG: double-strand break repair helicase AddA [Sandarakinorhabdus sp.]|nr:double-strand break repair helicase AddA [Sandarakinorhabdus sp.]
MTIARERAQAAQAAASDPAVSAFVAASAGSGKTKLLTDRLLRLMLAGADPAAILCLTYTKAAAAEMAIRLQTKLGQWVSLDESLLSINLRELSIIPTRENLHRARALFADVLDLPGGMRIGTIHAFCQSLLRRFPLEARLSPHFQVIADADAAIAQTEAREAVIGGAHTAESHASLALVAAQTSADGFGRLALTLQSDLPRLQAAIAAGHETVSAAQARLVGANSDAPAIIAAAVNWQEEPALRRVISALASQGSPKVAEKALRLLGWLGLDAELRAEHFACWRDEFLLADAARGIGALINVKLATPNPDWVDQLAAEQTRLLAVDDQLRALTAWESSAALFRLAAPVADAYRTAKDRDGLLDYADLIGRTSSLLVDPGAAWVLYKLDGGLDHLLLDEVQDTAPAQWNIAGALTADFFTGADARGNPRTIFAVGDRKQSIFSFQGANPASFEDWRTRLRRLAKNAGAEWRDGQLDVSFRSTAPILALVDQVFATQPAASGVAEPATLRHLADRARHAGRVELWPLTPAPPPAAAEPWDIPESNLRQVSAPRRLAEALADWIRAETDGSVMLESQGRPLAAGDILVLVRRRNAFADALVRALKSRGVPVAGLDRMVLTEQPAVADLLVLCDVLLLPDDDLALASVLTSPLGGLNDDDLIALAPGRAGRLWAELRARGDERPAWAAIRDLIAGLLSRVDFVSPYALLAEILGPRGGRHRLLARLGPEAAEPIDELLNAALAFAQTHPPSLQGFVHWLRQSGAQVKREAEGAGDAVRIMTVHSAKGLQAPVVILPDTTSLPPDDGPVVWGHDRTSGLDVPLWTPRKDLRCAAVDQLREAARAQRMEEHNRLLYVALTRAEDRLVICGWAPRTLPPECWYELVRTGFVGLAAETAPFDPWDGDILSVATPQLADPAQSRHSSHPPYESRLPDWAGQAPDWQALPPAKEPDLPTKLAPSRPANALLGPVPQAASPLATRDATGQRFRHGVLVHSLLQHLPDIAPALRRDAARSYLDRPGLGIPPADRDMVIASVLAVLDHPDLAALFGPDSRAETPLAGVIANQVIGGMVDRIAILPDQILIADYKTNRDPPARAEATPILYLRQMAAYRAVLRGIYPDRPVRGILIWTVGPIVTALPDALLDRHAPSAS